MGGKKCIFLAQTGMFAGVAGISQMCVGCIGTHMHSKRPVCCAPLRVRYSLLAAIQNKQRRDHSSPEGTYAFK